MGYLPDWLIDFITGKHPYAAFLALAALAYGTLTQMGVTNNDMVYWIFLWTVLALVFVFFISKWTEHNS